MDNETTRLINDPATSKQTPESTKTSTSNKSGKRAAAAAGGFVAGAALGIGGSAFAAGSQAPSDQIEESNQTDEVNDAANTATETAPAPEQVLLANDEGVRYAHVHADNFSDAFAQARAQVGPGGVFEYEGRLYGTYLADEWNAMSVQERADYQSRVNEVAPAHNAASSNHYASTTHNGAYANNVSSHDAASSTRETNGSHNSHAAKTDPADHRVQDNPTDIGSDRAEPVDAEIKVLGVESVQDEKGHIMNLAVVEIGSEQAMMIDLDNNGSIDVLLHDDNHDGRLSENEVYDMSSEGIDIRDLALIHMEQNPGLYQASSIDPEPDPLSDFDSYAEV